MNKFYRNGSQPSNGSALRTKQRGLTFASGLALLMVIGIFAKVGFSIGPAYFEYFTVKAIAKDISQDKAAMASGPKSKVMAKFAQAFRTNNLWDLNAADTIKLKKDGRLGYRVTVDYEKRINLFPTLDVVTVFFKQVNGEKVVSVEDK